MNSTGYAKANSCDRVAVGNGSGADKSPEHMLRSKILAKVSNPPMHTYCLMRIACIQCGDMQTYAAAVTRAPDVLSTE
jgi:hypothetical protein